MHFLFVFLVAASLSGTVLAEAPAMPAQPDIFYTLEFHTSPEDNRLPDYRPDDKESFYKLDNPFLPLDHNTSPFASLYGGENVFLGNGRVDSQILGSLDVMGGSFSPDSFYSTSGNAFLHTSQEPSGEVKTSAESEAYYQAVDRFLSEGQMNSPDPWPTLE